MKLQLNLSYRSLTVFVAMMYIATMFTPIFRQYYLNIPVIIALVLLVMTFGCFVRSLSNNKIVLLITVFFILEILYKVIGVSTAGLGNFEHRLLRFVSVWLSIYAWEYLDDAQRIHLFNFSIIVMIANVVDNLYLWITNPSLTMIATRNEDLVGKINIGRADWQYTIAMVGLSLIALYILKRNNYEIKNKFKVSLLVLTVFISLFLISFASSTTMVLSYVGCLFAMLILTGRSSRNSQIVKMIILIVSIVLIMVFAQEILGKLIEIFESLDNTKIARRLETLCSFLSGNANEDDLSAMSRLSLILIDCKTWISSPITFFFGSGYKLSLASGALDNALITGAGNHSALMDILPRYGLLGFILMISIIKNMCMFVRRMCFNSTAVTLFRIICVFTLFNLIFNDIIKHNVIFAFFFILPMSLSLTNNHKKRYEET